MALVRALVVEPLAERRQAITALLADRGWTIQSGASATTGLAVASWFQPALILIGLHDLTMSATTFVTLARARCQERVLIVGFDAEPTTLPERFDAVISWPFGIDDVIQAMGQIRRSGDE